MNNRPQNDKQTAKPYSVRTKRSGGKEFIHVYVPSTVRITIQDNDQRIYLDVPEDQFIQLIETDQRLCSEEAGELVPAREPQEILNERFNNPDYNAWHSYWRQDRKDVNFFSFDAWNEHDSQKAASVPSTETSYLAALDKDEKARKLAALRTIIANFAKSLPETQREVFIAWHYQGIAPADIARARGVSKAAISKTLNTKVIPKLMEALAAQGVNSSDLSGFLVSPTTSEGESERKNK